MTTTATHTAVGPLVAAGVTPIPFDFQAISVEEVGVLREGVLVDPATYTVTLNGDGTGTITPLATWGADEVYVFSDPDYTQPSDFPRYVPFYPDNVVPPLDRLARSLLALRNSSFLIPPGAPGEGIPGLDADSLPIFYPLATFIGPQGPPGDVGKALTRAAIAARPAPSEDDAVLLVEAGKEGVFLFEATNKSVLVAADPLQGVLIAPASDPTGASGAWVRVIAESYNVKWFGAVGDGVTDDGPKFAAALAYLRATALNVYGYSWGGSKLFVPKAHYWLNTTSLDFFAQIHMHGEGAQPFGGGSSILHWAAGHNGIRIQRYDTSGDSTVDGVTHSGGDGSIIEGLYLRGGYAGAGGEGEFHGILMKGRAIVVNCTVEKFEGDAIRIHASSGGAPEGNANGFVIQDVGLFECRSGLHIQGADSNSGRTSGVKTYFNRRWGINDRSFLGNMHSSPESGDNGYGASIIPTMTSFGGNRYSVKDGQEAAALATAPSGTTADNAVWLYVGAGGADVANSIPAYVGGITFRSGGSYYSAGGNASTVFVNPYGEGGQGVSQFLMPTLVLNGAGIGSATYAGKMSAGTAAMLFGGAVSIGGDLAVTGAPTFTGLVTANGGLVAGAAGMASSGNVNFNANNNNSGPQAGGATDSTFTLHNTNQFSTLNFISHGAGDITDGSIVSARNDGLYVRGKNKVMLRTDLGFVANVIDGGVDIQNGKFLYNNGVQVVGPRSTGWAADTGAAKKTATAAYVVGAGLAASAAYVQAEATAVITRQASIEAALRDATQEIKALKDMLLTHGLIGA